MQYSPIFLSTTTNTSTSTKLKGTGNISFHLGCNLNGDETDTLYKDPKKHIEKTIDGYHNIFGRNQRQDMSPHLRVEIDHPELDNSEFLDPEGI